MPKKNREKDLEGQIEGLLKEKEELEIAVQELQYALDGLKVITLDIETTHLKADFGFILCTVCKPLGRPPKIFRIDQYPDYMKEPWNDRDLCVDIKDYLTYQDLVITFNGTRFDFPFLESRLKFWGELKLPPLLHIDVLYLPRHQLLLHSNTLESVIAFLQTENGKTHIIPWIWVKAAHGDKSSLDYIVDHCEKDVNALEKVYIELKPYVRNIWRRR